MDNSIVSRFKQAWNAFRNPNPLPSMDNSISYSYRPDRKRLMRGNEKTIVNAIFTRIALDVSSIDVKHCRTDDSGRYLKDIDSGLNRCLTEEANIDQSGSSLMQDIVMSMLDDGVVAVVPTDTTDNPNYTDSYDILSLRTGKILEWKSKTVLVNLYNERIGRKQEIWLPKSDIAIIENPFYSVINEPNSTAKRLMRKLSLLDITDEQTASGKLDLLIQLPYVVKGKARKEHAEERRKDIEEQLTNSRYGVAYTDGTEKVIQLNRPVENNLMSQIEYLTSMLYSQLGITSSILDQTADEKTMLNYNNRTIKPIISAIVDEFKRKWLSRTAKTQGQTIMFFRDPFELTPIAELSEAADKFTRNEILSSNEFRQIIGYKPSDDPNADKLQNSNISQPDNLDSKPDDETDGETIAEDIINKGGKLQNGNK